MSLDDYVGENRLVLGDENSPLAVIDYGHGEIAINVRGVVMEYNSFGNNKSLGAAQEATITRLEKRLHHKYTDAIKENEPHSTIEQYLRYVSEDQRKVIMKIAPRISSSMAKIKSLLKGKSLRKRIASKIEYREQMIVDYQALARCFSQGVALLKEQSESKDRDECIENGNNLVNICNQMSIAYTRLRNIFIQRYLLAYPKDASIRQKYGVNT